MNRWKRRFSFEIFPVAAVWAAAPEMPASATIAAMTPNLVRRSVIPALLSLADGRDAWPRRVRQLGNTETRGESTLPGSASDRLARAGEIEFMAADRRRSDHEPAPIRSCAESLRSEERRVGKEWGL